MHVFDCSELRGSIPADVVELIARIREIRALDSVRAARYPSEMRRVEHVAILRSVKYSNEIEGIVTTDDRMRDLVERWDAPADHSECEIAGYRDMLKAIHEGHAGMDLDTGTVLALHRGLMSYTLHKGGRYKVRDNAIISVDARGRRSVRFRPVPASETADAMDQMVLAFDEARQDGTDPLLLIPAVVLDFLCIHPFPDGNGRVSRLLTTMLLYNSGIDVCRYVSLDEHIAGTRGSYYRALEESSKGWMENDWSYFPFVRYFLMMLLECYVDLDNLFGVAGDRKLTKGERIRGVIENSAAPVSKAQICRILGDVSPRTVESVLSRLQKDGSVEKVGGYRDARYRVARR